MLLLPLFIDISSGNLIQSNTQSSVIQATSLPFYVGDTISLQVYLLNKIPNPVSPTAFPFYNVPLNGLSLQCFITDGTEAGMFGDGNPYTQQIYWTIDPTGSFFYADLPLNTAALKALLANVTTATATLKFGFYEEGLPQTIFSALINLGVGIPEAPIAVPAPQTPLSTQVANQTFFPLQPVPGQAIFLMSPLGKIIEIVYVDNPDGSATLQYNPQN